VTSSEVAMPLAFSSTWGSVERKTAVVLSALEPRHLPALVIAPKRVAEQVWHIEKDLWRPDLVLHRVVGSPEQRQALLDEPGDVHVISRDNISSVRPHHRFRTLIIDELSGYRSRNVRWKATRQLARRTSVKHVWGLTGTPAPNGYMGLWAQVGMLDNGERLGKSIGPYRARYFHVERQLPTGHLLYGLNPGAEDEIKRLIEDICLSMESDGRVELPEFTVNPVAVELPSAVKKVYNDLATTQVADCEAIFGGEIHSAANAAALSDKLAQVTAGFLYVDDAAYRPELERRYTPLHTEKIKAVEEIINSTGGSGVLVFYRYRAELEMLQTAISAAIHIDEPAAIERWNRGEVPVLLAHPASAGHGLNLQHGGHTIVWTSPTWDLELWDQANKRLHRSGQQHPVVAHVLLANGSIDHLAKKRVTEKAEVQNDLLDYLRSPL